MVFYFLFIRLAALFGHRKARALVAGQKQVRAQMKSGEWNRLHGCIWIHAASVGEFEQARPLIYFIDNAPINKKYIRLSLIAGILSIAATCIMINYKGVITGKWDEGFIRNLVFIHAGVLFYLIKCLFEKYNISDGMKNAISAIGSVTFGIYVLECVYRKMTEPLFYMLEPYLPTFIATVVWILVACIFGGLVTYTLKHIPGIRRII